MADTSKNQYHTDSALSVHGISESYIVFGDPLGVETSTDFVLASGARC